jgi:hypothetical protein
MPVQRLGSHGGTRFDLIGHCHGGGEDVTHVGLLATASDVTAGGNVAGLQMGAKLYVEPPTNIVAHIAGTLPLSREQAEGLEEWIAEVRTLAAVCVYIALPAAEFVSDSQSGRRKHWKFSCAGFVETAYSAGAGVRLVVDETKLPLLELTTVKRIWAPVLNILEDEKLQRKFLDKYGLKGNGPWKVLVPGYLLHALQRRVNDLPYTPVPEDVKFA